VQDSKQRELQRRLDVEAEAVRAVLTDLQRQITFELADLERERSEQLSLFDAPEADQSQRDLDALRRRVDEIPDEIEREVAAIRRRYTDPESHVFPAAITFLVAGAV
jgi:polyhydroxyalkanoate synthesis regulator phasin